VGLLAINRLAFMSFTPIGLLCFHELHSCRSSYAALLQFFIILSLSSLISFLSFLHFVFFLPFATFITFHHPPFGLFLTVHFHTSFSLHLSFLEFPFFLSLCLTFILRAPFFFLTSFFFHPHLFLAFSPP
jgi:hypothetical protein